jgi:DNA-directed RNA polymerase specialized sigma24 family protein
MWTPADRANWAPSFRSLRYQIVRTRMATVSADLISKATAGDEEAFRRLVDPYRRELHVHCYRILGSMEDAEDALQETLLAAWRGLGRFEQRASLRTWLYRIATNRCLNALRSASRSPSATSPMTRPRIRAPCSRRR